MIDKQWFDETMERLSLEYFGGVKFVNKLSHKYRTELVPNLQNKVLQKYGEPGNFDLTRRLMDEYHALLAIWIKQYGL